MDTGIAVDFGGRGEKNASLYPLGQAEHVESAHDVCFDCLYGVVLKMDWRGWTGEMVDFIDFDKEWMNDVMTDQFEIRVSQEMADIILASGEEVIDTDDFCSLLEKGFAEMASQEPRSSSDQDAVHIISFIPLLFSWKYDALFFENVSLELNDLANAFFG
jgi:hypothetical protein